MNMRPDFFRFPADPFTVSVLAAAKAHACEDQPNEACGVVVDGSYIRCENVSDDPENSFAIDDAYFARLVVSGNLQAVIHSHPGLGAAWHPSQLDMMSQMSAAVPYAILMPGPDSAELACHWGGVRPALFDVDGHHVGREFLHGVSDCYTLCQDYFALLGVHLPDFARGWEWWKASKAVEGAPVVAPQSLYLDNLEAQGFEVVTRDTASIASLAQPGDAYLMQIMADVPNHAGVYLGRNLLLEHMPRTLSHTEPMGRKLKRVTHWLRHRDVGAGELLTASEIAARVNR